MKRVDQKILIIAVVAMAIALSGCQTTNGTRNGTLAEVGISTAVGSAVGLFINNALGSAAASAIAVLATTAISSHESKRVRSTAEERRIYGVTTPISSPQVKIQRLSKN